MAGVLVAERRTVVTFGPASVSTVKREERRERREQARREETGGKREERREERRERREERKEERGEKREERRERRGERGEEREERRERRGEIREKKEERRDQREQREEIGEERGERGERMTPDLSFLIGVARGVLLSLRCTRHVSAFGFVDPIRFSLLITILSLEEPSTWPSLPGMSLLKSLSICFCSALVCHSCGVRRVNLSSLRV